MKRYIKTSSDKFNGFKLVKSGTREWKPLIHNPHIRKNVSAIYLVYDPDTYDYDKEDYADYYYFIFFKEDTVMSIYDCDYINYGTTAKVTDRGPEYDINGWLNEIVEIPYE